MWGLAKPKPPHISKDRGTNMPALAIEISRFVDEYQPGIVECTLVDAEGSRHTFVEKLPVVTQVNLWSNDSYPQPGAIPCEIEAEWTDLHGTALIRVSTERPFAVESTVGQCSFVVLPGPVLR